MQQYEDKNLIKSKYRLCELWLTFCEAHRPNRWMAEHHSGDGWVVQLGVLLALKQPVCQLPACSDGNCHSVQKLQSMGANGTLAFFLNQFLSHSCWSEIWTKHISVFFWQYLKNDKRVYTRCEKSPATNISDSVDPFLACVLELIH